AIVSLDALRLPAYHVSPLPPEELDAGTRAGLVVVDVGTGGIYPLGVGDRDLLAWATGPLHLHPPRRGEGAGRFRHFRPVAGLFRPFRSSYALGDVPLIDERALAVCPTLPELRPDAFLSPSALPECGAP